MENQQPEALILVNDRPSAIGDDLYQWALDAEGMIRRLHARVEELEAMLESVGAGGVSAQRVTQSQTLKASSGWLIDGGLLYRLNDEGANCDEINVTMAGGLRTEAARVERAGEVLNMLTNQKAADHNGKPSWDSHQWPQIVQDSSGNWFGVREGWTMRIAPSYKGDELWLLREDGEFLSHGGCPQGWRASLEQRPTTKPTPAELNLDDYYCKGCGRIGEIEELSAQDKAKLRKLDGKPKTAAAPVVLPEPVAVQIRHIKEERWRTIALVLYDLFAGDEYERRYIYTEQQVRDLLAEAACTKSQTTAQEPFGYFKAEPFGWRDCAETDEGAIALYEAPQPQADARDVVPLPNERGWICKHPKYGTWFMSWAAVVKDLKQFREQFDDYNEPTEEDVDVWWREQTGWSEIEAYGSQMENPDMKYLEAAFRRQMKEDPDHVSYGGSVVEHHAAIAAAKEKAK